jgi:hypothetical protein
MLILLNLLIIMHWIEPALVIDLFISLLVFDTATQLQNKVKTKNDYDFFHMANIINDKNQMDDLSWIIY